MAKKKTDTAATNSNINSNTNNINVNVKVKQPRTPRKTNPQKNKPNWAVKAVTVAIIGLAISLLGYYMMGGENHNNSGPKDNAPQIKGTPAN